MAEEFLSIRPSILLPPTRPFSVRSKSCALTIAAGILEVLAQVTAKDPLPEDPTLFEALLAGPGLHEGAKEPDQLPMLLRH